MSPELNALLSSWDWRPEILLVLAAFGTLYTIGWVRLRRRSERNKLANGWRLFAYWLALLAILLALLSPIDVLAGLLFYMHMIQHLLLTMIAAPLIMLANPMPFVLWGLPGRARASVGRGLSYALHRESAFRTGLRKVTTPGICLTIMVMALWTWHDPNLYNLALSSSPVHDLEHYTFFFGALLYWWHATGAAPRIHPLMSRTKRMGYMFIAIPSTFFLGVAIAFSQTVLYTHYETVPRVPAPIGLSVMNDQILGGIIMWVPGSMMYFIGALVILAAWLREEERHKYAQLAENARQAPANPTPATEAHQPLGVANGAQK
jgi:putative membrane protein